jgi:hypothetical protein
MSARGDAGVQAVGYRERMPKLRVIRNMKLVLILLVCVLSNSAWAVDLPEFILTRHKLPLIQYLEKHPYFHVGSDTLCLCDKDLLWFRKLEPDFHPYYAVGDINDDGIEDFAVGLVDSRGDRDRQKSLDVVIFHGPFSKNRKPRGVIVIRDYPVVRELEVLSVFKARIENGHRYGARLDLGAGPFGSDDVLVIRYDWKAKKYGVRHFYAAEK